jgi:predicted ATPase
MIKHVRIINYKSLADVSVKLDPVTVLIGRSGAGKSNFVEALRWLRDLLTFRNDQTVQQRHGGWDRVMSATASRPMTVAFTLTFDAPGITQEFEYTLRFQQQGEHHPPQFTEEQLRLGSKVLFHQQQGKWVQPPPLVNPPSAGPLMLGGITGVQEVTIAHLVLTSGIGCYAFPDSVLTRPNQAPQPGPDGGLSDSGDNFLQTFVAINVNLQTWHHLRDMAASLRGLKPSLKSIDLQLPGRQQVVVSHAVGDHLLVFDLSQESEGFRRLLACLLALYQTPPKRTLIFDEPEKGIYPAGLAILADEFKGYAGKGLGQVILTTHSPEFLDRFAPEQIRVVEMHDYTTRVGPVAADQLDALREHFLQPKELLTVDEARLENREEALAQ